MAQITVNKLAGRTHKISDQIVFSVEDKASAVCKALGFKAPSKKILESVNAVSGVEAVAELAIKVLALSKSWPIFYKLTDCFGHYEVVIAD